MQVCLLANLRPAAARRLYTAYAQAHWVDHGFVAGFTEWPRGSKGLFAGDIDSGPVFMEIGATASGVGIGAAKAAGDAARLERLVLELDSIAGIFSSILQAGGSGPLSSWFGPGLRSDPSYTTGFLYGDAALFYALTWTPFPDPELQ